MNKIIQKKELSELEILGAEQIFNNALKEYHCEKIGFIGLSYCNSNLNIYSNISIGDYQLSYLGVTEHNVLFAVGYKYNEETFEETEKVFRVDSGSVPFYPVDWNITMEGK